MKNLKKISTAIFAVILFATAASAQTNASLVTDNNFSVKFVGIEEDYLCFQVDIADLKNKEALLRIDDKIEGELYSENFSATTQTLKFRIEKKEGQELNFSLTSGKKVYSKSFTSTTKFSESTTVKENAIAVL